MYFPWVIILTQMAIYPLQVAAIGNYMMVDKFVRCVKNVFYSSSATIRMFVVTCSNLENVMMPTFYSGWNISSLPSKKNSEKSFRKIQKKFFVQKN